MKIYNYKKDTKEYIDSKDAQLDPKESIKQGRFVYLEPAHSTKIQPPVTGQNEIAVFKNKQWKIEKDYRGTYYYNKNNGKESIIDKIGEEVPSNSVTIKPEALFKPKWNDTLNQWEEDAKIFKENLVSNVDEVNHVFIEESLKILPEIIEALLPQLPIETQNKYTQLKSDTEQFIIDNF